MDADFRWIIYGCSLPTLQQGALISAPMLISGFAIRVCVLLGFPAQLIHALVALAGIYLLWFFYSTGIVYFIALSVLVYVILLVVKKNKGIIIGAVSITFLLICETYLASPMEWHQVRGSFLVMVMRMVSLGFDLEPTTTRNKEKRPPKVLLQPSIVAYSSYCLFPCTSVFGPFLMYSDHIKFLEPSAMVVLFWRMIFLRSSLACPLGGVATAKACALATLLTIKLAVYSEFMLCAYSLPFYSGSVSWLWCVVKAWVGSMFCLAVSSCFMPFLFSEPKWNKWLAAYAAAASFRYSHYFVSLLSQCGALASGIGRDESKQWSGFHVVRPLAVELPRSLGTVVTNWNLPMHVFLKNYVYIPARIHIGRFGAILATYFASALLHGLNFQLGAVLLSIGLYAYLENVLRYKLSVRLDACVLDRPCSAGCDHKHKGTVVWVLLLNAGFTLLAVYHLAYLGVMFGSQSPEERELELQGFSMTHTLKKWAHLDFLSHWIALATYILYVIL